MAESYDLAFEKPPTKKNSGMTWNIHVASQSPDVTPTPEYTAITPRCHRISAMNQCPNTTARMDRARRKST